MTVNLQVRYFSPESLRKLSQFETHALIETVQTHTDIWRNGSRRGFLDSIKVLLFILVAQEMYELIGVRYNPHTLKKQWKSLRDTWFKQTKKLKWWKARGVVKVDRRRKDMSFLKKAKKEENAGDEEGTHGPIDSWKCEESIQTVETSEEEYGTEETEDSEGTDSEEYSSDSDFSLLNAMDDSKSSMDITQDDEIIVAKVFPKVVQRKPRVHPKDPAYATAYGLDSDEILGAVGDSAKFICQMCAEVNIIGDTLGGTKDGKDEKDRGGGTTLLEMKVRYRDHTHISVARIL